MKVDAVLIRHVATRRHPLHPRDIDALRETWPGLEVVELSPPPCDDLDGFDQHYPWEEAAELQTQGVASLWAALEACPDAELLYMGFAPIPLAFQLGVLLGQTAQIHIFNHQHERLDWCWPAEGPTPGLMRANRCPPGDSESTRALLFRVSASRRVAPTHTRELDPDAHVYDVGLREPGTSALRSRADLRSLASEFKRALESSAVDFPRAPIRHLAAAVPVGAAVAMGMQVSRTVNLPIQTWKFLSAREQAFVPAVRIGTWVAKPGVLLLGASPVDVEPVSAAAEVQELRIQLRSLGGRVRVLDLPATGVGELVESLSTANPTAVHLACHGLAGRDELPDRLVLATRGGGQHTVEIDDLIRLFGRAEALRCVVLAACESDGMARRIAAGGVACVGFDGELSDADARTFSRSFWASFGRGSCLDEAFRDGRMALPEHCRAQVELAPGELDPRTLTLFDP